VKSDRLISLINAVPGRVLFPLYRLFAVETHMFGPGGFVDRLGDSVQHVLVVAEALPDPPATLALATTTTPSLLDEELAACSSILTNLRGKKNTALLLCQNGVIVKLIGVGLSATGETHLQKNAAIWGWAGVTLQNNRPKKLGLLLEGVGTGLSAYGASLDTKIRHCTIVGIKAEERARGETILQLLLDARKIKF
jgi:hypothetical protein